jgi:hypothetical protein
MNGKQVHRRERVVGLQPHLALDALLVGDGAHSGLAHRYPPAAQADLAVLAVVPVGAALRVMLALRPGQIGDLGVDQFALFARHVQVDRRTGPEQQKSRPWGPALTCGSLGGGGRI